MMKRARTAEERPTTTVDASSMAHVLMLLSQGISTDGEFADRMAPSGRVFECKTCSRQFPSFQALGGHRASHKKPRLLDDHDALRQQAGPSKPKVHECSVCGLEFALGQALGGHMRRHRVAVPEGLAHHAHVAGQEEDKSVGSGSSTGRGGSSSSGGDHKLRIFGIDLDLSLKSPPLEGDSDLRFLTLSLGPPVVH